jgi:hypothetical protein
MWAVTLNTVAGGSVPGSDESMYKVTVQYVSATLLLDQQTASPHLLHQHDMTAYMVACIGSMSTVLSET